MTTSASGPTWAEEAPDDPTTPPDARQAMWDYANLGGRIFATHYHYTWFKNSPKDDWRTIANWTSEQQNGGESHTIDTSFPKGQAFAHWLLTVHASPAPAKILLSEVRTSLSSVNAPVRWSMVAR